MSDCPHCPAYAASAKAQPWREFVCECGVVYVNNVDASADTAVQRMEARGLPTMREYLAPQRAALQAYAATSGPPPPWQWHPNAALDMAALFWAPGAGEPGSGDETEEERAQREHRRTMRRIHGHRRLEWLQSKSPLFADAVKFAYGERGATLTGRLGDGAVADHCLHVCHPACIHAKGDKRIAKQLNATPEQVASRALRTQYRAWFARDKNHKGDEFVNRNYESALGNRLVVCATAAYERDEWLDVVPVRPAVPAAPLTPIERMRQSWAAAKAELIPAFERVLKRTIKLTQS